jgi:hypothetical protein
MSRWKEARCMRQWMARRQGDASHAIVPSRYASAPAWGYPGVVAMADLASRFEVGTRFSGDTDRLC